MAGPSFADCRAAARSVRSAEHGVRAVRAARPGTMLGIVRDRGPLSVLLYVALVFTILAVLTLIATAATQPVVV